MREIKAIQGIFKWGFFLADFWPRTALMTERRCNDVIKISSVTQGIYTCGVLNKMGFGRDPVHGSNLHLPIFRISRFLRITLSIAKDGWFSIPTFWLLTAGMFCWLDLLTEGNRQLEKLRNITDTHNSFIPSCFNHLFNHNWISCQHDKPFSAFRLTGQTKELSQCTVC